MTETEKRALLKPLTDEELKRIKEEFPYAMTDRCPTCHGDRSYRINGKEVLCECKKQKTLNKHYLNANIGDRYQRMSIEDLEPARAEVILDMVTEFVTNFDHKRLYGIGFNLWGPRGTGKTLVLTHVVKEIVKQGRSAYFIQFTELFDTWSSAWKDDEAKRKLEDVLKRVELLAIDDIVTDDRNKQGFLSSGLEAVVRHRYNNALPTIINTNLSPEKMEKEFPRVVSLLEATNDWFPMIGEDYRPISYRSRLEKLDKQKETLPIV